MPLDLEYLRRHYGSLSDQALLDIDRGELVDEAQKCYDAEIKQRDLASQGSDGQAGAGVFLAEQMETDGEPVDDEDQPTWLEDAAAVYSWVVAPGTTPAQDAADALDVLKAAGIPCYLEQTEVEREEEKPLPPSTTQLRLMVPGHFNLWATSVLERDIFNPEFEEDWRTHLEALSDQEIRVLNPKAAFCGLFDRIERVTKAYNQELARRGIK